VRDLKTRDFELEVRSVSDSGSFSGYASTFGTTPDSCGDVIAPGAFAESLAEWKAKGALPPCLWQHRADQPLGPFTKMIEDERGLFVEGQLLIKDVAQAREAHALVKAGTISGLSIGFQTIADAFDTETEIRTLTKVKIWEASLVTFPANEGARVEAVKALLYRSPKDFDRAVRAPWAYPPAKPSDSLPAAVPHWYERNPMKPSSPAWWPGSMPLPNN